MVSRSALNGTVSEHLFTPDNEVSKDVELAIKDLFVKVEQFLRTEKKKMPRNKGLKFQVKYLVSK